YSLTSSPPTTHSTTLHSFPTRRSSDLFPATPQDASLQLRKHEIRAARSANARELRCRGDCHRPLELRLHLHRRFRQAGHRHAQRDRKSTRLNSSHGSISYAVFCLKKKK